MNLIYLLLATQSLSAFTYKSYQTKIECNSKSEIISPNSLKELESIVKGAIKSKTKVKVIGSRHSITDVICTDGIPVHLKNFNKVAVDEVNMTATIGAGIELIDALDALKAAGVTIKHVPAYGGITVGGAIGLGAHGSSLTHANTLSEYLIGATFIDGKGRLRKIKEGDRDFDAFRVNFGLLGIFVDVTLKVVPSFKMNVHNYRLDDDLLTKTPNSVIDLARSNDWFQFWWFPMNKGLVISEGKHIGNEIDGNAKTNMIPEANLASATGSKRLFESIQNVNNTADQLKLKAVEKGVEASLYAPSQYKLGIFSDNGVFKNPAIGPAYQLMTNKCNVCGWTTSFGENLAMNPDEYSIGLPLSKLPEVIADMKDLFDKYPTPFPLIGLFFRLSPPGRGIMSLASGEETFHIDWTFPTRQNPFEDVPFGLSVMQSLAQLLVFKHGGRPHWGKNGLAFFSHDTLSSRYDVYRFKSVVKKYDPKGLFSNKFGDRILGEGNDSYEVPSSVTHCALQDYCICSDDSECPNNYKCGSLIGYSVCL